MLAACKVSMERSILIALVLEGMVVEGGGRGRLCKYDAAWNWVRLFRVLLVDIKIPFLIGVTRVLDLQGLSRLYFPFWIP